MCWQWGGIGILWCLISGCLRSPPPTLSCHSSWTCIHFSWCSPRQHWAFRIKYTLTYNLTSAHTHTASSSSVEMLFSSQTFLRLSINVARQPFQGRKLPFWFRVCQLLWEDMYPSGPSGPQMELGCHWSGWQIGGVSSVPESRGDWVNTVSILEVCKCESVCFEGSSMDWIIYSQPFSGRWWYNAHYNSLFCAVIQTQFVCLTFIYL